MLELGLKFTLAYLLGSILGFTADLSFVLVAALSFIYGITVMADSSPITAGTVSVA